jgi:succinoglycan biosynthesis protein ExoM
VDTLRSLAEQDAPSDLPFRVIVADNDEAPSARQLVEDAGRRFNLDLLYLHAPARNISTARNACLDAVTAPLVAFVDDDETVDKGWLRAMLAAMETPGAGVVFGPVVAVYRAGAPRWARDADLHSTKPVVRANGLIDTGYTSNVVMRRDLIQGERFPLELGRSGGEDVFFFHRLHSRGATLRFCPDAVVYEDVPEGREKLRWLLKRWFRSGQSHGRLLADRSPRRIGPAATAIVKSFYYLVAVIVRLASPSRWRWNLTRAAMHAGVAAYLLGKKEGQLY